LSRLKKIHLIAVLALPLIVFYSCGGRSKNLPAPSPQNPVSVDCTGFTSSMVIPAGGLSSSVGQKYASKNFAKLIAVDKGTGAMEITITPPEGQSDFYRDFLDYYSQTYTLRLIACREDPSSIRSGIDARRVCSTMGSINLIGKEIVFSQDFQNSNFVVDSKIVHETASPEFNQSQNLKKPNFIMLTAGLMDNINPLGDFMIAFGRSPYYNGCYSD
jgi:hypothetical protein